MRTFILIITTLLSNLFKSRSTFVAENLALRQQLATLQHLGKRPNLTWSDKLFWVLLSKFWSHWKKVLRIVQPETVVRWHQDGFKRYWTWKSRRRGGRPKVSAEIRELIKRMNKENPLWGAPRIHGELLKLGYIVSEATVSRYMPRRGKPPSHTWRTFLKNHMKYCVGVDFFTVPTAMFQILYVFIVLSHDRRRLVHFNVTAHPTAAWTAQQIIEAFPRNTAPRYLIRDRDKIYGCKFQHRVKGMGIEQVVNAPRSPWQNAYAERVIGSIRRECLNHVIVINELHLRRILYGYFTYYNNFLTHLSLRKKTPTNSIDGEQKFGKVVAFPKVGGLHHHYDRLVA